MKHLLYILFLLLTTSLFATHNRAGEITYKQISNFTYEITLTTYTYTPSSANEYRDSILIAFGDGTYSYIQRISREYLPDDYTKNTYKVTHSYSGAGSYEIIMEDPNRNQGILNVFDSVNIPFSVKTLLTIDPILGANNTPLLLNPPVDKAAVGEIFIHNPAAYDPDGDSLAYRLTVCAGEGGIAIPQYSFPPASNTFFIDSISGDLIWDAPTEIGKYNVAIVVEEWRSGVKIGEVVRDLQIDVFQTKNKKPVIEPLNDICVRANDTVRFTVFASDPDNDNISLSASGGPMFEDSSQISFPPINGKGLVSSEFLWVPDCKYIREQPYLFVFKATDSNKEVSLTDQKEVNIKVIGYPPNKLALDANYNSNNISWKIPTCNNAVSYDIYRATYAQNHIVDYCETGFPNSLQYTLITSQESSKNFSFLDDNDGLYLSKGFVYCYRMLAKYPSGAYSFVSDEVCTLIKEGLPDLLNVSVEETDLLNGKILIRWTKPSFDTSIYLPPYKYTLMRSTGIDGNNFQNIKDFYNLNDTVFIDSLLNTSENEFNYRIRLYHTDKDTFTVLADAPAASQPTINFQSANKELVINISTITPWENNEYVIYKKNNSNNEFDSIATVSEPTFTDKNLINGESYCYKVKTIGSYNSDLLSYSSINYSQEKCGIPNDTTPPPAVDFKLEADCENELIKLTILPGAETNKLEQVSHFKVYYKSCINNPYVFTKRVEIDSTIIHFDFSDSTKTMAGCYMISVVDSAGNESKNNFDTCIYTCPKYELPNVFTPNHDDENDLFKPKINKYVEYVDMKIYNRWNQLVFETKDSELNWDGSNHIVDAHLPDGVYYYVCEVYEQWLDCLEHPRRLIGFIHKFSNNSPQK
ncbi:MAG: gliding motility-associated C-terminal domain-containing protein [Bacteroidales bacterium]|nr:gliding motility-associated C-terminal domain-containing protein [Bacteroidales bacterium]